MALLNKMFNAKVLKGSSLLNLSEGVPQGNILSPILSNIYFTKLDEKVDTIIKKYNTGERATRNEEYYKAISLTEEEKAKGKTTEQINRIKKSHILAARKKGLLPTIFDDKYIRIKYVRYADDFIIGVRGCKNVATSIMREVKDFLKQDLHLTVNEEKSRITHVYSNKANFLGMLIHCIPTNQIAYKRSAHVERFRRLQLRVRRKIEHAEDKRQRALKKELEKKLRNKIKSPTEESRTR